MKKEKTSSGVIVADKRSVFRIGESLAITLPKEWVEQHKLREKDKVQILANKDLRVVVSEDERKKHYEEFSDIVGKSLK